MPMVLTKRCLRILFGSCWTTKKIVFDAAKQEKIFSSEKSNTAANMVAKIDIDALKI